MHKFLRRSCHVYTSDSVRNFYIPRIVRKENNNWTFDRLGKLLPLDYLLRKRCVLRLLWWIKSPKRGTFKKKPFTVRFVKCDTVPCGIHAIVILITYNKMHKQTQLLPIPVIDYRRCSAIRSASPAQFMPFLEFYTGTLMPKWLVGMIVLLR